MFGFEARQRGKSAAQQGGMPDEELGEQPPPVGEQMVARDPYIAPRDGEGEARDKVELFEGRLVEDEGAPMSEEQKRRHSILIGTLEEEGNRQAEERVQAQIDDDYYHHLQWKQEHAQVLRDRGQAPLVYNEARMTIDWLCGTERRLRKDFRVLPRSPEDATLAETKTKLVKYTEDVNRMPWHRSRAFKDAATSGLGWLEEGINTDPDHEMIFAGHEDWRRVLRDSRGRQFDQTDWRYIHRRKIIDTDYAMEMFPWAGSIIMESSDRRDLDIEGDEFDGEIWYLGERLTAAHLADSRYKASILGGDWNVQRNGINDRGRRRAVEFIETWYRVPERVQVFGGGPLARKVYDPTDPAHKQLANDRHPLYSTVRMRMRCMVGTMYSPIWDGPSPFRHGRFLLVPVWGYVRGRDGATYGQMRGMRDPQDDLNKRRSKALWALSGNRMKIEEGAVEDIEETRAEAARADGIIVTKQGKFAAVGFEKSVAEVNGNMELAEADIQHIRNAGGVTGENLGQRTNASSGRAIIAKQEQGSMVTYELFDNLLLAFKMSGELRLSHIEQFCTLPWVVRIAPSGRMPEWVSVNEVDPNTGQYKNDITASQADFIVDQQDYRATLTQAAMEAMFDLLGQMAQFSPQVVLALLDLAVDANQDIPNKDEWVARIRKMNGQRDPSREPSPEEQQAEQQQQAMDAEQKRIMLETAQAQLDVLKSKINDTNAAKVLKSLQGLLAAVEAAATIATMPGIANAADTLAQASGFQDATPRDPIMPNGPTLPALPPMAAPSAAQPVQVPPTAAGMPMGPSA